MSSSEIYKIYKTFKEVKILIQINAIIYSCGGIINYDFSKNLSIGIKHLAFNYEDIC